MPDKAIRHEKPVKKLIHSGENQKTVKKSSESSRVSRLIDKTKKIIKKPSKDQLESIWENDFQLISHNKVTGFSINVPIAWTCQPTKVCIKECYFAKGHNTWSGALNHQAKVYGLIKDDPNKFAQKVIREYDNHGLSFLRWNGGGDLFKESVEAINIIGKERPDIVLWVVTRIGKWASLIDEYPNVFIHFSIDESSRRKMVSYTQSEKKSENYFFSYQASPGEVLTDEKIKDISILFFDDYQIYQEQKPQLINETVMCDLNKYESIENVCENCRKCFDGTAVNYTKTKIS